MQTQLYNKLCTYIESNINLIDAYPINILCHLRLYEDYLDYSNLIEEIVKKCSEKNIKIEINTSERAMWNFEQFLYMLFLVFLDDIFEHKLSQTQKHNLTCERKLPYK